MNRTIVLLEDDPLQASHIESLLTSKLGGIRVSRLSNERAFHASLARFRSSPPDLFVLDIMVRWTDPDSNPNEERPQPEIGWTGYFDAGLRCQRVLSNDDRLRDVPILLYSVLGADDLAPDLDELPANVTHIVKGDESELLIRTVRSLLPI